MGSPISRKFNKRKTFAEYKEQSDGTDELFNYDGKRSKRQTVVGPPLSSAAIDPLGSDPSACRICNFSLDDKKGKLKMKFCDFCGLPACEECLQALRPFNAQKDSLLDLKEDLTRGKCCKVCVRKFIMKEKMDILFSSEHPMANNSMSLDTNASTSNAECQLLHWHDMLKANFNTLSEKIDELNFQFKKTRKVQQTMAQHENDYQKNEENLTSQI